MPSSATNGAPANLKDLEVNLPHVLRIYTTEQDRAHSLGHSSLQLIEDNLNPTIRREKSKRNPVPSTPLPDDPDMHGAER